MNLFWENTRYYTDDEECSVIGSRASSMEVTRLEYEGCSVAIHRKVVDSEVKYEAFADFNGDEDAARRFDNEMYNVNNIYSDAGALSGEDDNVHLECSFNPRDIIENHLGIPQSVWLEVKN